MVVNDLDTLTAMLGRAGIRHSTWVQHDIERMAFADDAEEADDTVDWDALDGPFSVVKVSDRGYPGFRSCYFFDNAGRLFAVGSWE